MRRIHLQGRVRARHSDRFDFELFGGPEKLFVPFLVAAEERIEVPAFYGFFAD